MYTYNSLAKFYDLEYGHKKDDILLYQELASRFGSPILEIGVGTGRVAIPLVESGFNVYGIDSSIEMLKLSQKKVKKLPQTIQRRIHLIAQDMRSIGISPSFPLCIIPFRTFLHNLTIQDQVRTLKCIHNSLKDDGGLVIEIFVPLYSLLNQTEWEEDIGEEELHENGSTLALTVRVRHDPGEQLLNITNYYQERFINGRIEHSEKSMAFRYIFRYEMEHLLHRVGFKIKNIA